MSEPENFQKVKLTIDLTKANVYGILGLFPILLLYGVPFYLIWGDRFKGEDSFRMFPETDSLMSGILVLLGFVAVVAGGIVVHELIHGLTWSLFTKRGFKSIRFGILKEMLTPYCHCEEPLKVRQYVLGAAMPAVILGFIPALVSLFTGNSSILLFGIFFTMAAIGDFMIIWLLRKESSNSFVLDHPSEAGCYVYRPK